MRAIFTIRDLLEGISWQDLNGSPTYPALQEHVATWLITRQSALTPQRPGHGSTHL